MDEKQKRQKGYPASDERDAEFAHAARRVVGNEPKPNFKRRQIGVAALAAGAILVPSGLLLAQHFENEAKNNDHVATIHAEYAQDAATLEAIEDAAGAEVDPASIVGIFDIKPGQTIDLLANELADAQPEYVNGTEEVQDWIDYTINKSGVAQGSYDVGDVFVVSRVSIEGQDALVVQDGEGVELPTLPSPEN